MGPRGSIRVNASLQTSDPCIYAVGDAIEVTDVVTGQPVQVPLAGPANRQGRIAANNIRGGGDNAALYRGTQGTAIVGVFDRVAAITGASEKVLKRAGRPYRKVYVHPAHHAGYYPGVAWCVSGRGYAPPSDTPRGLFPNSLMSTGTETGKGPGRPDDPRKGRRVPRTWVTQGTARSSP